MSDMPLDEIEIQNQAALEELAQTIELSVGGFHLFIVRCNYEGVRSRLISRLLEICSAAIRVLTLAPTTDRLYTRIREALGDEQPDAVLVVGFEQVRELDELFAAADFARDEFRKNLPFPLVLWLSDDQFKQFKDRAPNFANLAPADTLVFAIAPSAIVESLEQGRDAIFEAAFDPAQSDLPEAINGITSLGDLQRSELASALQFLDDQGLGLRPDLLADLEFIEGCYLARHAYSVDLSTIEAAIAHFQNAINHYRAYLPTIFVIPTVSTPASPSNLKLALALSFLGRSQLQQTDLARRTSYLSYSPTDWDAARSSLAEAVQLFEQCDRPDMTAKVILRLGRALRRLESWDELERVTQQAIALYTTYAMPEPLGESYGFLAEIALQRQQWPAARNYAQQALRAIAALPPEYQWAEGLYLSFRARAEARMGNTGEAIALLERARELGDRGHPTTYCRTLEALRELYWQQKRYLDAFKLKQARLEVEKIAGIRAFVGAVRLGSQARLLEESNNPDDLAPEIRASGRQLDLQRLLERIGRNDFKLTVIHGSSGVGKSSLMNAGLIPTLKGRAIGTRENRVVLVRKYTDWTGSLSAQVAEVFAPRPLQFPDSPTSTLNQVLFTTASSKSAKRDQIDSRTEIQKKMLNYILQQLRECDNQNLRPVLIFDQFEEFFFANPNTIDRRRFFEFLGDCLQISFINVILSLREDYIHYLLEANKVKGLGAIGSDILSNNVLYGLGNFSPTDAKAIIEDLTGRSRLYLEPNLIDALVNDLAGELREVRPIELQVVGAQLETEGIHTLADYQALGPKPKEELVTRYLQEVVQDCGEEYAALAARVLYELTDERGTRPLKTYPELQRELEAANFSMPGYPVSPCGDPLATGKDSLDYVLRMLAGSGIVMYLPEQPDDRYQLIHDYIAEAVREKYAPNAAAELAAEREKRIQAELLQQQTAAELEQAQTKNQKAQRRVALASGILVASLILSGVAVSAAVWRAHLADKDEDRAEREMLNAREERDAIQQERDAARRDTVAANRERASAVRDRIKAQQDAATLTRESKDARNQLVRAREQFGEAQKAATIARQTLVDTQRLQQEAEQAAQQARQEREQALQDQRQAEDERQLARIVAGLERESGRLYTQFDRSAPPTSTKARVGQLEFLVAATRLGKALQALLPPQATLADYPTTSPVLGLQQQLLRGQEKNRLIHNSQVRIVSFSPNGQQILTVSGDGMVLLWQADGQQLRHFRHSSQVESISFSPDGQQILTGSSNGMVLLWQVDGQQLRQFQHGNHVKSVSFSPDGQQILTGSSNGTVILWRVDGQQLRQFQHGSSVTSVSFSPNGQQILTGSLDGRITLWRADGQRLQQFQHDSQVNSLSFSPDDPQILAASGGYTVTLWQANGQLSQRLHHGSQVSSFSFSPNGQQILTGSEEDVAILWQVNGQQLQQFQHDRPVSSVSFSPDGQQILTGSSDGMATLWQVDSQGLQQFQHERPVSSVSFSPDGQQILTGSRGGTATLWNVNGQRLRQFQYDGITGSLRFSPNGQQVLTTSFLDDTATLWRIDGQQLQQFQHDREVLSLSFSPDGQQILVGSSDGIATLWRINGQRLQQFQHDGYVRSVTFSPDGQRILTGSSNGMATLWQVDGQQLQQFQHDSDVSSVSFSPDGQQILTGSSSGTATLWQVDGQQLQQFQHDSEVWSVGFSRDGQQILTGSSNGTVTLWRADGQQLQQFQHDSEVYSVSFSPDGQQIITGASDGIATLYPVLTLDEMIGDACDRLSNFLTHSPTMTDEDRALCNLPPRATTPSEQHSHNPIERLTGFIRRWLGA